VEFRPGFHVGWLATSPHSIVSLGSTSTAIVGKQQEAHLAPFETAKETASHLLTEILKAE
jgi:hypothetical protein